MSPRLLNLPAPAGASIRLLRPADLPLLRDHLLRLDPESRRDRFNGAVDGDFITRYAAGCGAAGVTVIGYFRNGAIEAAAEIHEPVRTVDAMPEVAFSVEKHLRRQGVGSALFAAMLIEAKRARYERLRVTTGAQNCAMRALAHKFGARLEFKHGELSGSLDLSTIKLPEPALSPAQDWAALMADVSDIVWAPWLRIYGVRPKSDEPQVSKDQ